ncbi:hypothetical protein LPB86_03240 [Pedobacter sp. MC2016-14]|uniref:hypothetical protein n=1 Tax=Pedobacter sp. MC2016-14 TaxID=2897327 RepID=UPI001E5343B5|nr:hypothetical protein [Pedobacter sp. MC2016-14]MCD0487226.1 hypothetical protein [Pedobacter sp. MC2016-14]
MKRYNINNLEQLHERIVSLKVDYTLKGDYLKNDAKNYVRQFSPGNLIKKYATPSAFLKVDDKFNISSSIMSLVLPVIMNSTLFRGSGFITKALVGLATSKVGKTLDAEHLSGIFNSVKSLFSGAKKKKDKPVGYVDYGIPPDSETY